MRAAAWESGTVPDAPTIATAQNRTDRVGRFAAWVRDAWFDLQRERQDWLWMRREFDAPVIPGFAAQSAGGMGIVRFGGWRLRADDGRTSLVLHDHIRGHRTPLPILDWPAFRQVDSHPDAAHQRPQWASVAPDGSLTLSPIPDEAYRLTGWYRLSPQTLTADTDIPEMPDEFHEAIQWRALQRMALFDEDIEMMQVYRQRAASIVIDIERSQLPQVFMGGALA